MVAADPGAMSDDHRTAAPIGAILAGVAAEAYGLTWVVYGAATLFALVTVTAWPVLCGRHEPDGCR